MPTPNEQHIRLSAGEHLQKVIVQDSDTALTLTIEQERDTVLHLTTITRGCSAENVITITLLGEGAECTCNGVAIVDDGQRVVNRTLIHHAAPHQQSHELYKYVLRGKAQGVFAGKVLVDKHAQKISSSMTNNNLCDSKESRMQSDPTLEIYADDVKCSHGSTIGQLNDAALFYMQQRGIPRDEAKRLLQDAFVAEVLEGVV